MGSARGQSPSQRNPDVSNKALITKSTPGINADAFKKQSVSATPATLHKLADDYYAWRNENYPVRSSEAGLHTWDDRLTDYSPAKIAERAQQVRSLLDKVRGMKTDEWPKNDRIDWILFERSWRTSRSAIAFSNSSSQIRRFTRANAPAPFSRC